MSEAINEGIMIRFDACHSPMSQAELVDTLLESTAPGVNWSYVGMVKKRWIFLPNEEKSSPGALDRWRASVLSD